MAPTCYPQMGQSVSQNSLVSGLSQCFTPLGIPMICPQWSTSRDPPKWQYLPSGVPIAAPNLPSPNTRQMCYISFHNKLYSIYKVGQRATDFIFSLASRYTDFQIPHSHHLLSSTSQFVVHIRSLFDCLDDCLSETVNAEGQKSDLFN